MQESRQPEAESLEALLEQVAAPTVVVDGGGVVLAVNGAALRQGHLSVEGCLGRRVDELPLGAVQIFQMPRVSEALLQRRIAELEEDVRRYRDLADHDALTGIANRRAAHHAVAREMARAVRYGGSLSVAMVDINGFKAINDSYGHFAGDAVLCAVAKRLQEWARATDLVGRWGGDEFLLILPGTDLAAATVAAARFDEAVSGSPVVLPFGGMVRVEIAIGVAEWTAGDGAAVEELLGRADEALYEDRRLRRRPAWDR